MNAMRLRNDDLKAGPSVRRLALDDEAVAGIETMARTFGLRVIDVDLTGCHDKAGLLDRTARALGFADDVPRQWDAWFDGLIDLHWQPAGGGYAILLRRALRLQQTAPESLDTALALLEDAARVWDSRGVTLRAFVDAEV
ncbi:MAG TPA: barstar family protein [Steroidobacteraceae bacterium]|nr:barstar family protein [Steroidobacteraceae bacterium]